MDKIGHVAAAPGHLACPSRGARPQACTSLVQKLYTGQTQKKLVSMFPFISNKEMSGEVAVVIARPRKVVSGRQGKVNYRCTELYLREEKTYFLISTFTKPISNFAFKDKGVKKFFLNIASVHVCIKYEQKDIDTRRI